MALGSSMDVRLYGRIIYLVAIPFVLTMVLGIIMTVYFKDEFPKKFDIRSWQNLFFLLGKVVCARAEATSTGYVDDASCISTPVLFSIHTHHEDHVWIYLRSLARTGHWFSVGKQHGDDLSIYCSQPVNSLFLNSLIAYVHTWRNGKLFFVFLMAFHISSIPFVTKASLVIYYVVIVVRIYCHTHTHTYTHTHTHTRTHHSQRWLPERELVLLCPCETTIIEREIYLLLQSYHHHIRHFIHHIIRKYI